MKSLLRQYSILPGFGITTGFTLFYLSLIVFIPLGILIMRAVSLPWDTFWDIVLHPRVFASYKLSFGASFVASLINSIFGFIVAWVLVKYNFPGKKFIDALVDLPFALPTAVSGIALTSIYAGNGLFGKYLTTMGLKVAFTPAGIIIALTFIGFPFVVRTLQPVLQSLNQDVKDAAASLGATRLQIFTKVTFPTVFPAIVTGFASAFARALGEYGSVIFIAGNMPMKTEITPLLIVIKLEQYDYTGATAIATSMLIISFVLLLIINLLQNWSGTYYSAHEGGIKI